MIHLAVVAHKETRNEKMEEVAMQSKFDRWTALLNEGRRKKEFQNTEKKDQELTSSSAVKETRTEIERDYDRILFSTPVRRLADKTQVFPLDKNDSVRTRLTHSHEVSNLARSIGTSLVFTREIADGVRNSVRNIPALLASAGLVHDLGNPPFGHQGEGAIQSWFRANEQVLSVLSEQQHKNDFLLFEGNAQGFRLVTRLQLINDDFGLDLTHASLASMMKYPIPSDQINKTHVAKKKHGFFASEQHVVEYVHQKMGLSMGQRHPIAYLMEACDDIAYVVLDAEDAVKKGLASFSDLISFIENSTKDDEVTNFVVRESVEKHKGHQSAQLKLSPAELNDVSMQRFRVCAIGTMVRAVTTAFVEHEDDLLTGVMSVPLIEKSTAEALRKALKEFSFKHAYTHKSVLEVELKGYNVIRCLMDFFWAGIVDREDPARLDSKRRSPFTRYVYGRISENYRRVFENPTVADKLLPIRYRECILLTDMISGMTDSFAVNLCDELEKLQGEFRPAKFLEVPET